MKYRDIGYRIITIILIMSSLSCNNHLIDLPPNEIETNKKSPPIEPFYPIPSKSQLEWQNSELVLFIHFGMNTFTDKEWGDGTENPEIFNPTNLNADQWVKIGKEIGFKYIILTAKHHDGFCLWPSQYTSHSIQNSLYKNGKGDIVKEFADACHRNGVNYCFYLSPWDRHDNRYGTDEYNTYFQNQLIELLNNYGDVGEVWFDGANGEGPNGHIQIYNWDLFYGTVNYYRPDALMAVSGPDIRWIGNENGLGSETEWSIQPRGYNIQNDFGTGNVWYPSECDVSIRPGWFYHASEDFQIKSVDALTDIYFKSVGRNSNLLLNVPPDKNGLISQYDVQRLREWKQHLDQIFANDLFRGQLIECSNFRNNSDNYSAKNCLDNNINTFWTTDKNVITADLTISLPHKENINIIRLEEAIEFGQRIKTFSIFYDNNGTMEKIFDGTTIGRSRIIKINTINTNKIKIEIKDANASPTLREIKAFYSESVTPD
jgi:alpha-L-fucosidase